MHTNETRLRIVYTTAMLVLNIKSKNTSHKKINLLFWPLLGIYSVTTHIRIYNIKYIYIFFYRVVTFVSLKMKVCSPSFTNLEITCLESAFLLFL